MRNKKLLNFAVLASIAVWGSNFLSMPGTVSAHSAETHIQYEDEVNSSKENDDSSNASSDEKILGDVNSDGKVTKDDAEILSEYIKGNITCDDLDLSVADVNRDRRIEE